MLRRIIFSATSKLPVVFGKSQRYFSVTSIRPDLMEFFDDKKNWGEQNIRVGRSWRVDELRIKSNTDLHKLWYVLLRERNMLFTMEHEAKEEFFLFPNPERIDKVEESMANIETVVRERNRAYHLLETGKTGERSGEEVENFLGLQEYVQHKEYAVPKEENKEYLLAKEAEPKSSHEEKKWFLVRWAVKKRKFARAELRRKQFEVIHILRNFPDCDKEALQEKYPEVDVDRYIVRMKIRNYENLESTRLDLQPARIQCQESCLEMVKAWYLDGIEENPGKLVLLDELHDKTGILHWKLNMETLESDGKLEQIRQERQYGFHDIIDISPENLPNYEAKVKGFETEHQHPEEEIRMVLKGTTFFDVRDFDDQWIRIQLVPGDLLVLPPGIYHRLRRSQESPDVVIYRLFKERPAWTSFNRHSTEDNNPALVNV